MEAALDLKKIRQRTPLEHLLFIDKLVKKFNIFASGNSSSKAQAALEITLLLKPDFILNADYGVEESEIPNVIRKIFFNIFKNPVNVSERVKLALENKSTISQRTNSTVDSFFDSVEEKILYDPDLDEYRKFYSLQVRDNEVKGAYNPVQVDVMYGYDTMQVDDVFISIIVDLGSRKIISWLITESIPTAEQIINWLDEIFYDRNPRITPVLHCDMAGCNASIIFKKFCDERGIRLSNYVAKYEFGSQVVERTNGMIKRALGKYKLKDYPENITFGDYNISEKRIIINAVINIINQASGSRSLVLGGYSRNYVDSVKEFIQRYLPETFRQAIINGATGTEKGDFSIGLTHIILTSFQVTDEELALSENSSYIAAPITLSIIERIKEVFQKQDTETLVKVKQHVEDASLAIKKLTEENGLRSLENLSPNQLYTLSLMAQEESLKAAKNDSEKRKIISDTALLIMFRKESQKSDFRSSKVAADAAETKKAMASLAENSERLKKEVVELRQKQDDKKRRAKRNRALQSKSKAAVMPGDFEIIMKKGNFGKLRFKKAKFRLGHGMCRMFGIRIGNLKYFNMTQLTNVFSGRSVFLYIIKGVNLEPIEFPYVRGMEKVLKYLREDYEYMKDLYDKKDKKLSKVDKSSSILGERVKSEIWGSININRFTKDFNEQLLRVTPYLKVEKRLTSHSYRRGFAIVVTKIYGIRVAQQLLGHASTRSTEAYLEKNIDPKTSKEVLNTLFAIETTEDLEKTAGQHTLEEAIEKVDELISKENLGEKGEFKKPKGKK